MEPSTQKTARFKDLVEKCGTPEAYTAWVDPKRDSRFQAAWRENRVLTIHQNPTGHTKDFGVVGFHNEANVGYLLFPKPLTEFEGRKIVGIAYEDGTVPEQVQRVNRVKQRLGMNYTLLLGDDKQTGPVRTQTTGTVTPGSSHYLPRPHFPNGLANSSGLVGRYMCGHSFTQSFIEVSERMYPGMYEDYGLISRQFFRCKPDQPFVRHDLRIWESSFGRLPKPDRSYLPSWPARGCYWWDG